MGEEGLTLPFSFFITPLALAVALSRWKRRNTYPKSVAYLSSLFTFFATSTSALYSLYFGTESIIFGLQWSWMFIWMFYFSSIDNQKTLLLFIRGFSAGSIITSVFYFTSGALEYAIYGGLQDEGRMTQNLVLPGQYQVYVYVPTLVAYSLIILNACRWVGLLKTSWKMMLLANVCSAGALLFFAAREAVVVVMFYALIWLIASGGAKRYLGVATGCALALIALNAEQVANILDKSDFRLANKFANLDNSGAQFGGRDTMIEDVSGVFDQSPFFGTYFMPPNAGVFLANINAPSAHNMYVDALAWSGAIGGILYIGVCVSLLFMALKRFLQSFHKFPEDKLGRYFSLALLTMLLISNNLNVPMRQPVIAPLVAFMIYICAYWAISGERGCNTTR